MQMNMLIINNKQQNGEPRNWQAKNKQEELVYEME
tara:strand:- start:130 stop:234 length:105 start_codon:yes stop_codon:yes gene_type:complete